MAWNPEARAKYKPRTKKQLLVAAKAADPSGAARAELSELFRTRKAVASTGYHTTLDEMFSGLGKTAYDAKCVFMQYVRWSSKDDERLLPLWEAWDKLSEPQRKKRKLEDLCTEAEVSIPDLLAIVTPRAYSIGSNLSKIFVSMAQPMLAQKAISEGMGQSFKDRQMILQAGGTAPTPHGTTINVQQNNAQVNQSALPDFSETVLDIVDAARG